MRVFKGSCEEGTHLCSSRCSTASRRPSIAAYPARSSRRRYPKLQHRRHQQVQQDGSPGKRGRKESRTPKLIAGWVKVERMDEGVFLPVVPVDDLLRHSRLEMRHSQCSVIRRGIDLQRGRDFRWSVEIQRGFNHTPSLRDPGVTDRTGLARTKLEERDRVGPVRLPVPPPPVARLNFRFSFAFFAVVPDRVLRRARFRFDGSPCVGAVPQADVPRLVARKDLTEAMERWDQFRNLGGIKNPLWTYQVSSRVGVDDHRVDAFRNDFDDPAVHGNPSAGCCPELPLKGTGSAGLTIAIRDFRQS